MAKHTVSVGTSVDEETVIVEARSGVLLMFVSYRRGAAPNSDLAKVHAEFAAPSAAAVDKALQAVAGTG